MSAQNIELILAIILLLTSVACMYFVYKRDLLMLQLNSYRDERYIRWFKQSNESVSFIRMACCIALFALLVHTMNFFTTGLIAVIITLWCTISLATKKYKKPLVFTKRVYRLYLTMLGLSLLIVLIPALFRPTLLKSIYLADVLSLLLLVISPIIMLVANNLLKPVEKNINNKYYRDAQRILNSMPDLKIIGVTGSYGKTSTKHYLHRILSEKYDVMMTPGSFNTTMGVIRTIREHLKPYNEVFIVEMGAKQSGDIKEICDLVHPQIAVVTAVGEQHLESFKTIENIQKTKFEIVDALPSNGLAVLNDDFEKVADRNVENVRSIRYAINNKKNASYTVKDIHFDSTGTSFSIIGPDIELKLHTRLVGECNVSNLLAAVIIALELGVDTKKIAYAVDKIEQVEHRLNLKRTAGGITIIDDAFNSNPAGSKMALDVLKSMEGGKRIIVTPGMIELGDKQFELNKKFGEHISNSVDLAIIVGEYNKAAILEGLKAGKFEEDNVFTPDNFNEAQKILAKIISPGDTILYENDLPDTFK